MWSLLTWKMTQGLEGKKLQTLFKLSCSEACSYSTQIT